MNDLVKSKLNYLLLRWRLECAELHLFMILALELHNFEDAKRYKESKEQVAKHITEIELLLK